MTLAAILVVAVNLQRAALCGAERFFGLNEVGEAGKEAIIPLERNTEWTGQVAKLLAQHLYDLPQPTAPSMYSTDNAISDSDMVELVALLRAIRSDVAAVRQSSGGSVTVNTKNNTPVTVTPENLVLKFT